MSHEAPILLVSALRAKKARFLQTPDFMVFSIGRHDGPRFPLTLSTMNGIMVLAWMLWEGYALERGQYYGLGMRALQILGLNLAHPCLYSLLSTRALQATVPHWCSREGGQMDASSIWSTVPRFATFA